MKIVQIISGGMDSVTLLYHLKNEGHEVSTLSFNYGQKHNKELGYVAYHTNKLNVHHKIVDLTAITDLLSKDSVLINKDIKVPTGHYENPIMKSTIVPNRNMMMLSVAGCWALSLKYDTLAFGAHFGDNAIYPDCRESFIKSMEKSFELCDWHKLKLITPFKNMLKEDIAKIGGKLNLDYSKTWTCYRGEEIQCGECATCIERREALYNANITDITEYSTKYTLEELVEKNWLKPKAINEII